MKKLLLFILCPFFLFGQTQIGENLYGEFGLLESLYGYSVDISDDGNTVIIGSPLSFNVEEIKTGKVEIYHKNNDIWEKIGNTLYGKNTSDFFGIAVSISSDGNIIAIGASNYESDKTNQGLIRTYKNESNNWIQIGDDLLGDNAYDRFGRGVELSNNGNVLLAVAPENDENGSNSGQVKIFNIINGTWQQKGNSLNGTSANSSSGFNATISSDGNTVAIGVPIHRLPTDITGKVFVYKFNDGFWYDDNFSPNSASIDPGIYFGTNLKLSSNGSTLIVSQPLKVNNIPSYVRVFNNNQGSWQDSSDLIYGISDSDRFGSSLDVSSDGLKIAIGSTTNGTTNGSENTGYVQFFELDSGNNWIQINNTVFGKSEGSNFGRSLSVNPNFTKAIIGSPYNRDNGYNSGLVSIYEDNQNNWEQTGNDLIGDKGQKNDSFGESVALSPNGDFLFVGSPDYDLSRGRVKIYQNNNNNWNQIGTDILGNNNFDELGSNIQLSLDGNTLVIGASTTNINGSDSGYLKIYKKNNNEWIQLGKDIIGTDKQNYFGSYFSVSKDGKIIGIKYLSSVFFYELVNTEWVNTSEVNINDNDIYLFNFDFLEDGKKVALKTRTFKDNKKEIKVIIYSYDNNQWILKEEIFNKEQTNDGSSVDEINASSNYLIFDFYNEGVYSVFIYKKENENWSQYGNEIKNEPGEINYIKQVDVSVDGTIISISYYNSIKTYQLISDEWTKIGNDLDFSTSFSLALDGKKIAIGNPFDDINGINSGIVKVFDFSQEVLSTLEFITNNFKIYPNPSSKQFTIQLNNLEFQKASIYNNLGQFIKSSSTLTIDTSNLSKGIYFLEVETNKGKSTKKLIVE